MADDTPSLTVDHGRTADSLQSLVTGQGGRADSRTPGNRRFRFFRRTHDELQDMYRANWLAAQITDIPAFEMTREWRYFDGVDPDMIQQIEDEEARLDLRESTREAIQWADLFGGGALFMSVDGTGDLHEELKPEQVRPGALRFVHALDKGSLIPHGGKEALLVQDPTSVHFRQPVHYQIVGSRLDRVHCSRIVKFHGLRLPWREMVQTLWWGGSRIERIYDVIADAEQVIGGIADLVTEAKIDVYKIPNLHHMLSTPEGTSTIQKRIATSDAMKSIYQAIIVDANEDYEQKQNAIVQGLSALFEQFVVLPASGANIPVTRLLGTSAKGLNATGEGDLRNFYDMIRGRQNTYLRARLALFDEVMLRSLFGEIPDDIRFEFGNLYQQSDFEVAQIEAQRANRDKLYFDMGVVDELTIARQLKIEGTYSAIDEDFLAELEEISSLPPPVALPPTQPPRTNAPEPEFEPPDDPAPEDA